VLKALEGEQFDEDNQKKYQILLIKNKLYKPTDIPRKYANYYSNPTLRMDYDVAEEIFNFQHYESPSMRGRQSANPLSKLGFAIAREQEGEIVITELGNRYLADDYDVGYIFFKSLLKLQFPNPWSKHFSAKHGFDVVPFIATMHLISLVNKITGEKGITKTEFSYFAPSLINHDLIAKYAKHIDEYRKTEDKDKYLLEFAKEFYGTKRPSREQLNNFNEYGDNTMRYFRLTRYFRVDISSFGADWRIDLEPTRRVEIDQLLKKYDGSSNEFKDQEEYLGYLSDIDLPRLPFENIESLRKISKYLIDKINENVRLNHIELEEKERLQIGINIDDLNQNELKVLIDNLRDIGRDIAQKAEKIRLLNNVDVIKEFIVLLNDNRKIRDLSPELFEKAIASILRILNDEINIKPNYPMDDNGEPIGHAPGNRPDIECFYKSYNAIIEVTLDTSNFQWVRETQPVMRHLREFEKISNHENNYCLFIAPKIHQDTSYHFWFAVTNGYDGAEQNILPLTARQVSLILETLLELIAKGRKMSHDRLMSLYDEIVNNAQRVSGHTEWVNGIDDLIGAWKKSILA
jgi:hypothetical protein